MSYIGRGIDSIDNISTLDNLSFNGSDATFNLTKNGVAFTPISSSALNIQIDGIIQSNNYSVNNATVTFDFVPSASSVCNNIRHYGVGLLTTVSDSSITTAKLGADAVTTAKINDGAVTSSKIASGVIPSFRPNANAIIVNGSMDIAQRGTSTSGVTSSGYYACDRWRTGIGIGTWTISQDTDVPTGQGFAKSMKIDCTTANASPSASSNFGLATKFEGQNLQYLKKGTSNALSLTCSFWVKSNKTGDYTLEITDSDNSRSISQSYSISSANTWEKKTLTFAGDTTGTLDNDNAQSIELNLWLSAGSNYTSGTLQTSWGSQVTANRAVSTQVNLADSTANEWYITGVQLEVGEYTSATIPPFQHESFEDNLERCRRYYEKSYAHDVAIGTNTYADQNFSDGDYTNQSNNEISHGFIYKTSKRSTPSITVYDHAGTSGKCNRWQFGVTIHSNQSVQVDNQGAEACRIKSPSGNTAALISYHYTANSEL